MDLTRSEQLFRVDKQWNQNLVVKILLTYYIGNL